MSDISRERPARRTIAAAVIGNALDWYDFTLYGYLATTIGKLFFPAQTEWTSLLSSFALTNQGKVGRTAWQTAVRCSMLSLTVHS